MKKLSLAVGGLALALFAAYAAAPANARMVRMETAGPAPLAQTVHVNVHFPLRSRHALEQLIANQGHKGSPLYHRYLSPAQFAQYYGPDPAAIRQAATYLRALGFNVRGTVQGIDASANVATVQSAFRTQLNVMREGNKRPFIAAQRLVVPQALKLLGATVVGLAPTHQRHVNSVRTSAVPNNRYSTTGPYWFTDLKEAYSFPSYKAVTGKGSTIAIVISSDFNQSDVNNYFNHEKLAPPKVLTRAVDGGTPFNPNSGDSFEAMLDIEQSGGMAPGATIIDYNIPDLSDQEVYNGYSAVIADNQADIVNSSFGLCELYYTAAYNGGQDFTGILAAFHDLFQQGNAQGITFVASSGDNGALDCVDPTGSFYTFGVENPADDPDVTAVGGTNLITVHNAVTEPLESQYVRESAYADPQRFGGLWGSGGGMSVVFDRPLYQDFAGYHGKGRGVPDLAFHMGGCPQGSLSCGPDDSADVEAFAGGFYGVIGTSASSPDFAGLLALKEQNLGGTRLGNENWDAYVLGAGGAHANPFYRNNIPGNNGYPSRRGYNFVVGNGSVIAHNYAFGFFQPLAGDPQTPSNP